MKKIWWYRYKKLIYTGHTKQAKKLLLKRIPEGTLVYKYYRGINRDWESIKAKQLWLCQAKRLNDPFDCAFLYNCKSKDVYDSETEGALAFEEYNKQVKQDKKSKDIQKSIYVTCFSEIKDSLLMWSHYADEHRGICLGYDLHELIKEYDMFPVIYSNEMPKVKNADINKAETLLPWILVKSKAWSYEKEWRIVQTGDFDQTGKVISFVEPKEIYIGACDQDAIKYNHEKTAKNVFDKMELYIPCNSICSYANDKRIPLFRFNLCRDKFLLNRCSLNI